jgi:hypothetical protein
MRVPSEVALLDQLEFSSMEDRRLVGFLINQQRRDSVQRLGAYRLYDVVIETRRDCSLLIFIANSVFRLSPYAYAKPGGAWR